MISAAEYGGLRLEFSAGTDVECGRREFCAFIAGRSDAASFDTASRELQRVFRGGVVRSGVGRGDVGSKGWSVDSSSVRLFDGCDEVGVSTSSVVADVDVGLESGVSGRVSVCESAGLVSEDVPQVCSLPVRGLHYERNKAKREREKLRKKGAGAALPEWRRGAVGNGVKVSSSVGSTPSLAATVATVTTEVAEELEARRTLAARRVVENEVATEMGRLKLASLRDKDKTSALAKLELARIQERINTATAKSQASYKKCDSPLDSVGSAGSAGEFAWKQEIRKRDAVVVERDYLRVQLDEMLKTATPEMKRAVAAIPEPYIPTDEEIAAMDEDIAPYMSQAEMEAETERYFSRADIFFERD